MNALTIREAAPADAPAVAALINLAFEVEAFFATGDRTDQDEVRRRMERGRFLLLEDDNGSLAGCVFVDRRGDRGYFGMLSIDPARHGQGLGRRLVEAAEDASRSAGCRVMEIDVVNLRTELLPFYRRLGYVERGRREFPYSHRLTQPCHLIVMDKPLDGA